MRWKTKLTLDQRLGVMISSDFRALERMHVNILKQLPLLVHSKYSCPFYHFSASDGKETIRGAYCRQLRYTHVLDWRRLVTLTAGGVFLSRPVSLQSYPFEPNLC